MESAGRSLRYEEARQGDILSINKERERENWVLKVRKWTNDNDVGVIILMEMSGRELPGSIKNPN